MKKLTIFVLITSILLLFAPKTFADGLDLKEVYIDYKNYLPGSINPIINTDGIPHTAIDQSLDLHVNMEAFDYIYWNNMVNSITDSPDSGTGQFRVVGLEFGLGVHLLPAFDVGYYHHSQHILDHEAPYHFPIENAIQVKFILYSKVKKESLF